MNDENNESESNDHVQKNNKTKEVLTYNKVTVIGDELILEIV